MDYFTLFVQFFIVLQVAFALPVKEPTCGYQSCPVGKPDMLNVHIIAHTHDDVGWLKTLDQYYFGGRQSTQRASVQYILDSVLDSLYHKPERKFIYVETAFFWKWWNRQTDAKRNAVKKLVSEGRLEFIGGGWVMNDEATAHYSAIIDQMTYGLKKLNSTFGKCGVPKVAWQIDPFGHSREQASLFAQMFFDGLFHGRIDYQDKDRRLQYKEMEFLWHGSESLGKSADLFTGILYNNYSPPPGFCFDILCDDVIVDDPTSPDYNVDSKTTSFINYATEQAKSFVTNHIPVTMGNDFNYQYADAWFSNLDKLIKYVNDKQSKGSKVNLVYSTPSCYLYNLYLSNKTWTTKPDDFFPYSSDPHAFWTGYFTSRPAIKGYVRQTNAFLQSCKQLETVSGMPFSEYSPVNTLRDAVAVAQHHDAVTGTEKQHVASDYARRLNEGVDSCQQTISKSYQKLLPFSNATVAPPQEFCKFLNISQCKITETSNNFVVTVYNSLGQQRNSVVRFPVMSSAFKVTDSEGKPIEAQVVPIPEIVQTIPGRVSKATLELVFQVSLPPAGYASFFVQKSNSPALQTQQKSHITVHTDSENFAIKNDRTVVLFDGRTRLLKSIQVGNTYPKDVKQQFLYYNAMKGNNSEFAFRASGAYIFRPNGSEPLPLKKNMTAYIVKGPVVEEVWQIFGQEGGQVIRLYKGRNDVELDWVVGPIDVSDKVGKEIISRFNTDLNSNDLFYTDSNGRELLERKRNFRSTWKLNLSEPVSGNYYPVNAFLSIKDTEKKAQVTILTDRSQGGSSLQSGQMELMVHRRLLFDDAFGVDEALNETGVDGRGLVVRGKHYLLATSTDDAPVIYRKAAKEVFADQVLSFVENKVSQSDWIKQYRTVYSSLKQALPDNVHLLTLEHWSDHRILIRLEHFYQKSDDPQKLSKVVTVNLKDLFKDFSVVGAREVTLAANLYHNEARRLDWNTNSGRLNTLNQVPLQDFRVTLHAMEIRTFVLRIR